jgi:FkbM family methyltransferase
MKLVFDIGANVGNTVEQFLNNSEKVICFEPNPALVSHLKHRFNGAPVVVDGRGVSNHKGKQIFKISNANTISTFSEDWINNSRFTNSYNWNRTVEVETTTLDSIIDEYGVPDYIKIDIEGYEYEVLTSFSKLLSNTVVAFEWAEEQKLKIESTINYLNKLGYNMFGYTISDGILYDDQVDWKEYNDFNLLESLLSERKEKWGMIYFKKN